MAVSLAQVSPLVPHLNYQRIAQLQRVSAGSIMTSEFYSLRETAKIKDMEEILAWKHHALIPVTDDQNFLVGQISSADVMDWSLKLLRNPGTNLVSVFENKILVGDIMNREIFAVSPSTSLLGVTRLMSYGRRAALPVVRKGVLVGLVTPGDLFQAMTDLDFF